MKNENKKDERFEKIEDFINNEVCETNLVELWNAYCEEVNYSEDIIYYISDMDDIFGRLYPSELFQKLDDDFNWDDEYFYVDRNGYLMSTDYPGEDIIDYDEMIEYMIENDEDMGYKEIREILDGNFGDEDNENI